MVKLLLPVALALIGFQLVALQVQSRDVKLYDSDGQFLELGQLDPNATTVGQLRRILSLILKSKTENIKMITRSTVRLEDDKKLVSDYSNGTQTDVVIKLQNPIKNTTKVAVKIPTLTAEIDLQMGYTVNWLRETIYKTFYATNTMVLNGQKLNSSSKLLDDFEFYKGAHLILAADQELHPLTVKKSTGEFVEFHLLLDATVAELKQMIQARANVVVPEQILLYYTTVLDDNAKVFSYSKAPNQGLILQLAKPLAPDHWSEVELYQELSNGRRNHQIVKVTSYTTVEELKSFGLQLIQGTRIEMVHLEFQNKILNDDEKILSELAVYEGAWIKVVGK